jgi:hypothetical protein
VLKYVIFGFVAGFALLAAGFYILAKYNDRNAEAGQQPPVTIVLTNDGAAPARVSIAEDALFELRIRNERGGPVQVALESDDVEQMQDSNVYTGVAGAFRPGVHVPVPDGETGRSLVRFKSGGTYEMRVTERGVVVDTISVEVR